MAAPTPPQTASEPAGRIVVGVDGSADSVRALRWALRDAEAHGRPVHVIRCYPHGGTHRHPNVPAMAAWLDEDAERALEHLVEEACDCLHGVPPTITREAVPVGPGGAVGVLLDRADDAALLVVGRRGVHGPGARMLGSVSAKLAGLAPCPVVVVGDGS